MACRVAASLAVRCLTTRRKVITHSSSRTPISDPRQARSRDSAHRATTPAARPSIFPQCFFFARSNARKAPLQQIHRRGVAFVYRPVELSGMEREGLIEQLLGVVQVEQVARRRVVQTEHPHLSLNRRVPPAPHNWQTAAGCGSRRWRGGRYRRRQPSRPPENPARWSGR